MTLFFFDLRSRCGCQSDDTGLEFASAEAAYIEACKAIPELTAELARTGDAPQDYTFEITDEAGRLLWHIPFRAVPVQVATAKSSS